MTKVSLVRAEAGRTLREPYCLPFYPESKGSWRVACGGQGVGPSLLTTVLQSCAQGPLLASFLSSLGLREHLTTC